jgi:LysR family transcriptional regulator for metE and metH
MLLAGKIDVGIMSTPVRDRRLVSRRVFDDELVLITSPSHRFAQQARVRLAQMRDETLFIYPPKEESGPLQNVLIPAGAMPARVETVQLTEAITELVKVGLGVAILARWAVQPLIDAGTIVGHSLPARGMHRVWSAVMPKDLARTDYVNEFIDLLEQHAPTSRRPAPALTLAGGGRSRRRPPRHADRSAV